MNIINILISLAILLIGLLILNIDLQHILVILIITTIILFIITVKEHNEINSLNVVNRNINMIKNNSQDLSNVRIENINLVSDNNISDNNISDNDISDNDISENDISINNVERENEHIINPSMYNLDDCTTDMTCIQKPNKENLFPGFDKREFKINNIKTANCDTKQNKVDGMIVEKFISSTNPFQLNDISVPFNSSIIDPYEHYKEIKNKNIGNDVCSENSGNDLCFHCRKGHCSGGVCRNIFEAKPSKILDTNRKNILLNAHPYSENQPVIRASNPDFSI